MIFVSRVLDWLGILMFRDASIDTFIHFHDPINMYARVEETEPVIVKKLDHQ